MSKHHMELIAGQVERFNHGDYTNVLRACSCGCGRTKIDVLKGGWTADDLLRAYKADNITVRACVFPTRNEGE